MLLDYIAYYFHSYQLTPEHSSAFQSDFSFFFILNLSIISIILGDFQVHRCELPSTIAYSFLVTSLSL